MLWAMLEGSITVHWAFVLPAPRRRHIRSAAINQVCIVDSVLCDFDNYPYTAKTYARQMIIRQSNVTERSLVTVCRLTNSSRSDDNPNGFIIEGFNILENRDISTVKR